MRDEELEKQYTEYRDQFSKEGKIVYIRPGEREEIKEIERRGAEKREEEMVRNLLANGFSPEIIAKSAGVSVERVLTLAN